MMRQSHVLWSPGAVVPAMALMLGLLLAAGRLGAQGQASPEPQAAEPVPAERASARATMQTFLKGWASAAKSVGEERRRELRRVIETLDLGDIPQALRAEQGEVLAFQLKAEVIDKYAYIDYGRIPDDPGAEPYRVLRSPRGLEIVVAPDERGDWRFTRESVRNIPLLAAEFSGRATVAGVHELQELKPPAVVLREMLPDWMRQPAFVLYLYQWIGIAVLAIASLVLGRAVALGLSAAAGRRLREAGWLTAEHQQRVFSWPLGVAISVPLWWAFDGWLGLPPAATRIAQALAVILFGIGAIVALLRLVDALCARLAEWAGRTENKFDDLLIPFARKAAKIVLVMVGALMVMDNLGMDLRAALGTLAIGGLAISLAAKDTISNLFGTVTIIGDSPFQIGDYINVSGVEGTVETLGFRSTRLRTAYDSLVTIPNANLTNAVVDNLGARKYRRYRTMISIAYNTPSERIEGFCEGIREIIRRHPYTRKDYYHAYFNEFAASSLNILLNVFFEVPDWSTEQRERHRLNADIHRLAEQLGIEFAFPTQTLYLARSEGQPQPADHPVGDSAALAAEIEKSRLGAGGIVDRTFGAQATEPGLVDFDDPRTMRSIAPR